MRIPDLAAAVVVAAMGGWLVREGRELGLGEPTEPGSGFMFWWLGVAFIVAAAALAALAVFARRSDEPKVEPGRWRMVLVAIVAMVAYGFALEPAGYIPASAVLLTFLFIVVDRYSWPVAAGLGTAVSIGSWFLFAKLLSSNLPAGLLAGTFLGS